MANCMTGSLCIEGGTEGLVNHLNLLLCSKTAANELWCALQPLSFELDGQQYTVVLAQFGQAQASTSSAKLRAAAMLDLNPISSYLFGADGKLLHANNNAAEMIKNAGACCHSGKQALIALQI